MMVNDPMNLPSAVLAAVLAFSDGGFTVRKLCCSCHAWETRFHNDDSLWSSACSLKWSVEAFDWAYFQNLRTAYDTLTRWTTLEGYYSLISSHPIGSLVKLELLSERRASCLVWSVDGGESSVLFLVDILSSGEHTCLPGPVYSVPKYLTKQCKLHLLAIPVPLHHDCHCAGPLNELSEHFFCTGSCDYGPAGVIQWLLAESCNAAESLSGYENYPSFIPIDLTFVAPLTRAMGIRESVEITKDIAGVYITSRMPPGLLSYETRHQSLVVSINSEVLDCREPGIVDALGSLLVRKCSSGEFHGINPLAGHDEDTNRFFLEAGKLEKKCSGGTFRIFIGTRLTGDSITPMGTCFLLAVAPEGDNGMKSSAICATFSPRVWPTAKLVAASEADKYGTIFSIEFFDGKGELKGNVALTSVDARIPVQPRKRRPAATSRAARALVEV